MGKWSRYQGLEGKYLVHPSSHEVKRLKRYLFQDFYLDSNDEKVYIGDLDNVFGNEEEAKALSCKLLAEDDALRAAYNEEKKLRKEKEEEERKSREKRDTYLDNLSYSERRYYLD
jgi:hypothetical protein